MVEYKESLIKDGVKVTKVAKPVVSEKPINFKKGIIRNKIEQEVFDANDSIADNAKMIMLLLSMIKRLYNAQFNIDNLSSDDRALIEFALNKYEETTTRMDIQFQEEGGTNLIEKLLTRQQKIADIIQNT